MTHLHLPLPFPPSVEAAGKHTHHLQHCQAAPIDYLAHDGSEIRLLPENKYGGIAHCTLPPEKTSKAVKHKTVEEIWYILEGKGKMWRKKGSNETVIDLKPNLSLTIPTGTNFQFINTGSTPLKIIIATMPPWPGAEEAEPVEGCW